MSLDLARNSTPLSYRKALPGDAGTIAALVNIAYRGESSRAGWTTEADLITGARTTEAEIAALIAAPDSFILLCVQGDRVIGTVLLQKTDAGAYLGLFVVQPDLQGGGIGKQFLQTAEALVQAEWAVTRVWMTVITVRAELVAYYERRGYQRTGQLKPFPTDAGDSVPVVADIQLEVLEKFLTPRSR